MIRDRKSRPPTGANDTMINLVSAASATPQHAYNTSVLVGHLMHKLSPELINAINSLGVEQRYSTLENYPDCFCGKKKRTTSSTTDVGVYDTKRCNQEWGGNPN